MNDPLHRVRSICHHAAEQKASDVFLSEGQAPRIRLHGMIQPVSRYSEPMAHEEMTALWQACHTDPDLYMDRDVGWASGEWRFRVNLHRHLSRLGAVLRIIERRIPTMESLNLPAPLLQSWGQRGHGLILFTGPTGSGKSTTVASLIDWINGIRPAHIVTIEEPIEFVFESKRSLVTQREISIDVPDFLQGLRYGLRQSPDIIFLGEIRDFDSARIALQAAETGHLVLTTLHTGSVTETMERLTNLMPADKRQGILTLLAAQLIGVFSQKLIPAMEGGRRVVVEHFQNEAATRDWIRDSNDSRLADFIKASDSELNCDFSRALLRAFQEGHISADNALRVAPHPPELQRRMQGLAHLAL